MIAITELAARFDLQWDKYESPYLYDFEKARFLTMAQEALVKEIFNDRVRDKLMNGEYRLKLEDSKALSIYLSALYEADVTGLMLAQDRLTNAEVAAAMGNYAVSALWHDAGMLAVDTPFTGIGGLVGTGILGAILAGDYWTATATIVVGGTFQLAAGEIVYALVDGAATAGQFAKFVPVPKKFFYPMAIQLSKDGVNYYPARYVRFDNKNSMQRNAFQCAIDCDPFYVTSSEYTGIYPQGKRFRYIVDVLRWPRQMVLDDTYPVNNVDCDLDEQVATEVVERAVRLAAMSIRDNGLYQAATAETNQNQV